MKQRIAFLFLFVFCCLWGSEPTDILFYVQDAGETLALKPVWEELQHRGISVKVLRAGTAKNLLGHDPNFLDFPTSFSLDASWKREQTLPVSELQALADLIEPQLVVTGVAYELQAQVLDLFKARHIPVVAYWDNFNRQGTSPYFQTAESVASHADFVLVPTQELKNSLLFPTFVVGQPTLEKWQSEISSQQPFVFRQKLGICSCKTVLLFIGGYGEEYKASLDLFARSLQKINLSNAVILFQPHPKFPEALEEEALFRQYDCPVRILQNELDTKQAVAMANIVACHQSTVSFQAASVGKTVIHFIPEPQSFESALLQKGLAYKVTHPQEFPGIWNQALKNRKTPNFFELLGIPRQSTSLCSDVLIQLLR